MLQEDEEISSLDELYIETLCSCNKDPRLDKLLEAQTEWREGSLCSSHFDAVMFVIRKQKVNLLHVELLAVTAHTVNILGLSYVAKRLSFYFPMHFVSKG
jgi:hypothetical protein